MLLAIPPGFSVNPLSCKMPCAMLQDACVATQQHQPSGLKLCPSSGLCMPILKPVGDSSESCLLTPVVSPDFRMCHSLGQRLMIEPLSGPRGPASSMLSAAPHHLYMYALCEGACLLQKGPVVMPPREGSWKMAWAVFCGGTYSFRLQH